MTKTQILEKSDSGKAIFDGALPAVGAVSICGTEIEFGAANENVEGEPQIRFDLLPILLPNGGEVYQDFHVEYAAPETSNPVEAVAYYEAGKLFCSRAKFVHRL